MATVSMPPPDQTAKPQQQDQHVKLMVAAALVAAAFAPLLWIHCEQLWGRPHYQFFPIVFAGAAVLAWQKLAARTAPLQPGTNWISWGLMGWSWALLATAELLNSSWLSAVALVFLVLAVIYAAGGRALVGDLLPAWLFLWLIVPPPFGLDQTLVLALQQFTTQWSSALLDLFRVYHVVAGNVVEIGAKKFFVAEACTGVNSLFSILACTLFYVFFARPPVIRAILLMLAAIAWVLLANVARVFLVVFLWYYWGIEAAEGMRHELLGFALFAVALALIWSTDRLLLLFTPSRSNKVHAPPPVPEKTVEENGADGMIARRRPVELIVVGTAFAALLLAHTLFYIVPYMSTAVASNAAAPDPQRLNKESLPADIDGWKQDKFFEDRRNPGSAFGEYSKTWTYKQGDVPLATFSIDYPFGAWHELQECYRNQGWEVKAARERTSKKEGTPTFYFTRILNKTGQRTAYLFYCEFDQSGRVMQPAHAGLSAAFSRRDSALQRLQSWAGQTAPVERPQVGTLLQFQMLVESTTPLSEADLTNRFFLAYRSLHKRLF